MTWEEYTYIRSEIISLSEIKHNYILTMTSGCIAIMVVELELRNPYMSLLIYVLLFSFQSSISRLSRNMHRLSAFLAVFGDDKWEKNLSDINKEYNKIEKKITKNSILERIQSIHLAAANFILCVVVATLNIIENINTRKSITLTLLYILVIVLSTFLNVFFSAWCEYNIKGNNCREKYIECLNNSDLKKKIENLDNELKARSSD